MTALLVVLMVVGFAIVDVLVRLVTRRLMEARERKARAEILDTHLRLDFTHESKSLKRVEVPNPRARILAVDDEPVVLDSFRKILVLAGFNVDTVESGLEALGLVQKYDYDFIFTDLKMPVMDGVEVVKAVKHMRPDVDVAVITGYATIESAVETMQHGAMDYVQKPFTEDELTEFANRLLVKREARLEAQRMPTVRLVAPRMAESAAGHEYCVPGGAFVSSGHVWVRIEGSGQIRVGIDDFARKALGALDCVEMPKVASSVKRGEALFTVRHGDKMVRFAAPMSGEVVQINDFLIGEPSRMNQSPYDKGWVCLVQPSDLAGELSHLKIGRPVVDWYQEEIARWRKTIAQTPEKKVEADWDVIEQGFLKPSLANGT